MTTSHQQILIKSASYLSFIIAILILFIKIYGYFITNSQSMLVSLIDSVMDLSSSFINLIAIRFALQPPDYYHRFGHEKIQDLAIFSQSIFFLASGLFACYSSIKSLLNRMILSDPYFGTNTMYLCLFFICILVIYQTYVIKKTNSEIIKVDKLHYFTDLLTNITVIISISLSGYFWYIDSLFGISISIYIIYASYLLFKKSFKHLIDEELLEEDRQKIISIITQYKEIKGIHDMKTRYAANKLFIQCHLEMDGNMSLYNAHIVSDQISNALLLEFPEGEIIIHQDPYGIDEQVSYRERI